MRVRQTRGGRWRKPMKALWPFRGFWGVSGEVRFEIMGRGEAELHDDGFGSSMSDEALTSTVSDEPGIGSPMSDKALIAANLADRS
ncbi:hypothetical protein V6N11_067852 [Hibiscus sabdariffa]|uniref:Uncharacterized protein n=1 Tax=Hibiscus sabdariffa TaxID=183260 RepID=A0ABR2SSC7_9ROSI